MEILYGSLSIWHDDRPSQSLPGLGVCLLQFAIICTDLPSRLRLPEAFIWQAFNEFAKVAVHMSSARFHKSVAPVGENPFILHLDLKHDNSEFHSSMALFWLIVV